MSDATPATGAEVFFKSAATFLCGSLMRDGYRVARLPGAAGVDVSGGHNVLVADRAEKAVVLALRHAVASDEFTIDVADELVKLRGTFDAPLVFIGMSRIPSSLAHWLSQQPIHVFLYPQTGMKELVQRIEQILAEEGWSIELDPGQ